MPPKKSCKKEVQLEPDSRLESYTSLLRSEASPPKSDCRRPVDLGSYTEKLVIVESPSKIHKIEQYLGPGYRVIASMGHITMIEGLKSIDHAHGYSIQYTSIPSKKAHIEDMRRTVALYPRACVIIATDNDREGEGIGFHLCNAFGLPIETTQRILFNEITPSALQHAVAHPTTLNMKLIHAQQARQVLDMFIGFHISPLLWKYVYSSKSNALSAGRCQTPALGLIYDNYMKGKEGGEGTKQYKTVGHFFSPCNLACELNHAFQDPLEVKSFLEQSKKHIHTFTISDKTASVRGPPAPLNTSKLLQSASHVLHLPPKSIMSLAQKLYQEGHITYMRTESKKYSPDFLTKVTQYIVGLDVTKPDSSRYVGDLPCLSSEGLGLPHEAIRVTDVYMTQIDSNDTKLNALYRFIWKTTIESCMSAAEYEVRKIHISAPANHIYAHSLDIPVFLGWKRLVDEPTDSAQIKQSGVLLLLQSLQKKAVVPYTYIESAVTIRGTHTHYTESALIQRLEEMGIGRPSTYAMFVETIQERGYVIKTDVDGTLHTCTDFMLRSTEKPTLHSQLHPPSLPVYDSSSWGLIQETVIQKTFGAEHNKLVIQPLGIVCIEFLLQHFQRLFDYSYTKSLEEELDKIHGNESTIESGSSWYDICERTRMDIKHMAQSVNQLHKEMYPLDELHDVVFRAFGPCVRRRGCENDDGVMNEAEIEYIPIRPSIKLDMERLKQQGTKNGGGYRLEELILYKQSYLGKHQDLAVFLQTGPHGLYLEWGDVRKSLGPLEDAETNISWNTFTLETAIDIIVKGTKLSKSKGKEEEKDERNPEDGETNSNVLRVLNDELSVRKGQYGSYIYYKNETMARPTFINSKKYTGNVFTGDVDEIISWCMEHKDDVSGGRGGRGRGRGGSGRGRGGSGRGRRG